MEGWREGWWGEAQPVVIGDDRFGGVLHILHLSPPLPLSLSLSGAPPPPTTTEHQE